MVVDTVFDLDRTFGVDVLVGGDNNSATGKEHCFHVHGPRRELEM